MDKDTERGGAKRSRRKHEVIRARHDHPHTHKHNPPTDCHTQAHSHPPQHLLSVRPAEERAVGPVSTASSARAPLHLRPLPLTPSRRLTQGGLELVVFILQSQRARSRGEGMGGKGEGRGRTEDDGWNELRKSRGGGERHLGPPFGNTRKDQTKHPGRTKTASTSIDRYQWPGRSKNKPRSSVWSCRRRSEAKESRHLHHPWTRHQPEPTVLDSFTRALSAETLDHSWQSRDIMAGVLPEQSGWSFDTAACSADNCVSLLEETSRQQTRRHC